MIMQAMPGVTWRQATWGIPLVTSMWHVIRHLESRGTQEFFSRHEPNEMRQKVEFLKWVKTQPDIMARIEAEQSRLRKLEKQKTVRRKG